jgi:hypothetical protein
LSADTYRFLADAALVAHALWILWVVTGVLVVHMGAMLRRIHLSCVAITLLIMITVGVCPLTTQEVRWREMAGQDGYAGGFIAHYVSGLVYGDCIPITRDGLMVLTMLTCALAILLHFGTRLRNLGMQT